MSHLQAHHKNSNRHGQAPLGPFTITASGQDGDVFVTALKGWLLTGLKLLLSLFRQPSEQPYAFLHPSTCKPFSVPSFCNYFKKHLRRMSGMDISPGKLR